MAGAIASDLWLLRERLWERLSAAAMVLILHILLLVLMQVHPKSRSMVVSRETIVTISITPTPAATDNRPEKKAAPAQTHVTPSTIFTMPKASDFLAGPFAPLELLSICTIANLDKLSLEQQRRCHAAGLGVAERGASGNGYDLNSAVKDPARWQAELDRKNSPVLLPGGVFLPLLVLGAALGQDNILRHPDKWPTYPPKRSSQQKTDEARGLYRTPKLPGE